MKTIIMPGKKTEIGVRMVKAGQSATECEPPTALLVAIREAHGDNILWASTVGSAEAFFPLALQWPKGTTVCSKDIIWSFDAENTANVLFSACSSSTSALIIFSGYGRVIVSAICNNITLTASIDRYM